MILREVAAPNRYSVYAVVDRPNADLGCEVERFLLKNQGRQPKAIRDLNEVLRRWAPKHGPPFELEHRAKRLRDGACEFRASQKRRRQVPRILFIEDGRVIICTNAFMKSGATPQNEVDRCLDIGRQYFADKAINRIEVRKGWAVE
jgi:hypothetical protein